MLMPKLLKNKKGQAAIEMAFALPFLIFLIYHTIIAYIAIHTSHVAQHAAANNLHERVQNRAVVGIDQLATDGGAPVSRQFMGVEYEGVGGGRPPRRRIDAGQIEIRNIVGICREPDCK